LSFLKVGLQNQTQPKIKALVLQQWKGCLSIYIMLYKNQMTNSAQLPVYFDVASKLLTDLSFIDSPSKKLEATWLGVIASSGARLAIIVFLLNAPL